MQAKHKALHNFGARTHHMVAHTATHFQWDDAGTAFSVINPEALARNVLPLYFDHASYASWTRALHAHSFYKLSQTTWTHPQFMRDDPEAAAKIARKKAKRNQQSKPSPSAPAAAAASVDALAAPLAPVESFDTMDLDGATPEMNARLAALAAQIRAERKMVSSLKESLERAEAQSTRARREELQLRLLVVHIATLVANAASSDPDAPALAAAQAVLTDASAVSQLPALTCSAEASCEVDRFAEHLAGVSVSA